MDKNIVVSIGMPVYNKEPYLGLAIKSVLAQSLTNFELIICNDGSTDNSEKTILSFNDNRIKYIKNDFNQGISACLNHIISISKGKYFARMDADDIMFPDRLKIQLKHLEKHTYLDVIGASAIIINDNHQIVGKYSSDEFFTLKKSFFKSVFVHPTVMGHLKWFQNNCYNPDVNGAEDFDLFLRTFNTSKFQNLQVPLMFYRINHNLPFQSYKSRHLMKMKSIRMNSWQIKSPLFLSYLEFYNKLKLLNINLYDIFKMNKYLIQKRFGKVDSQISNLYQPILSNLVQF